MFLLRGQDHSERDILFVLLEQLFWWPVAAPLIAGVFLATEHFHAPNIVAILAAGTTGMVCVAVWGPYATRLARHLRPLPDDEAD